MDVSVNPSILILHYYFPTQKRNVFDSRILREWDSNPRPSAYETDNLTADISRTQKLTNVSLYFNDL